MRVLLNVVLYLFAALLVLGGPRLQDGPIESIEVRNHDIQVICVVRKPDEVERMIQIIRGAKLIKEESSLLGRFTHTINIPDRWLYDELSGEIARLSKTHQPIYRISDAQKREFESFLR
ncbi:hypothetical protein CMV30_17625 [Nibricoccus aquaticus]|uniref:Uncharacterized protein n=1 Tax=Nibricoccus aquaticus TaxID=2576891 RepID=A0A290QH61_9BACT|nr:hypothetical protein CMV30_17625 [Nibricoccus aquaticus]